MTDEHDIGAEEEKLRMANLSMMSDLNLSLKQNKLLALKRNYVNSKYTEYGDFSRVDEIYDSLSSTFIAARNEAAQLKSAYESAIADVEPIPAACESIRNAIIDIAGEVALAGEEIDEILETFPDLEERAAASAAMTSESAVVKRELESNSRRQGALRHEFQTADSEKQRLEKQLADQKKTLTPLVESETDLNDTLSEIADRFERQEALTREKVAIEEAIGSLETKMAVVEASIHTHETELAEKNQRIAVLKDDSAALTARVKDYEEKILPFRELTEGLEKATSALSALDEQSEKITGEVQKLRKDNDMLETKAKQFGVLNQKLEGLR